MSKHKANPFPKFKTFVAGLEDERDLIGLANLLSQLIAIDEITTGFANIPYFDFPACRSFFDGESSRLAERICAIVEVIKRLPITGKTDRSTMLGALMKYAAYVGDGVDEVAAMVEMVRQKPITPREEAA